MAFRKFLLGAAIVLGTPALAATDAPKAAAPASKNFTGATANLAPGDPPGQWTRQARDYANTRYSPLTQINTRQCRAAAHRLDLQRRPDVRP